MEKKVGKKARVLFVCAHNASRSQMAEGLLRHAGDNAFDAYSAGTQPRVVDPLAVEAMAEAGIDISAQRAKSVDEFVQRPFDFVITLCDDAKESCPFFPHATARLHWAFRDPSTVKGTHEKRLAAFREVRDGIRDCVQELIDTTKEALNGNRWN